jgi:2-hydroxy-3-keto-5-methylthiopentenyl-1-phosphate phosphatase
MNDNMVIQCDFDGTITEKDVSFALLDMFATDDWRKLLEEYRKGKMTVGKLNTDAFSLVKEDRQTLIRAMDGKVKIRAGFHDLVDFCNRKGIYLHIVSNGLDFYIEHILKDIRLESIPFFAAQTTFSPGRVDVVYRGPDGTLMEHGLKEYFVNSFLEKGCKIIYIGNGPSDFKPARLCHQVFAIDDLVSFCKKAGVSCVEFNDFNDILAVLETD